MRRAVSHTRKRGFMTSKLHNASEYTAASLLIQRFSNRFRVFLWIFSGAAGEGRF
jgi:hypothetical protein